MKRTWKEICRVIKRMQFYKKEDLRNRIDEDFEYIKHLLNNEASLSVTTGQTKR